MVYLIKYDDENAFKTPERNLQVVTTNVPGVALVSDTNKSKYNGPVDLELTYNVTSTTAPTQIYNTNAYLRIEDLLSIKVDDKLYPISSFTASNSYTFDTLGEHNVVLRYKSLITLGKDAATARNGSFESCRNLVSVVIPGGVKYIEGNCFAYCSNLSSITSLSTSAPFQRTNTIFQGVKQNGTLYVLSGSTGYGNGYTGWLNTNMYYLGSQGWTLTEI